MAEITRRHKLEESEEEETVVSDYDTKSRISSQDRERAPKQEPVANDMEFELEEAKKKIENLKIALEQATEDLKKTAEAKDSSRKQDSKPVEDEYKKGGYGADTKEKIRRHTPETKPVAYEYKNAENNGESKYKTRKPLLKPKKEVDEYEYEPEFKNRARKSVPETKQAFDEYESNFQIKDKIRKPAGNSKKQEPEEYIADIKSTRRIRKEIDENNNEYFTEETKVETRTLKQEIDETVLLEPKAEVDDYKDVKIPQYHKWENF